MARVFPFPFVLFLLLCRYSAPPSRSYSPGPATRGYVERVPMAVPVLPYGGYGYGFSPFSPFGFVRTGEREGGVELSEQGLKGRGQEEGGEVDDGRR